MTMYPFESEDATASTASTAAAVAAVATAKLEEEVVKNLVNEEIYEDGNVKPTTTEIAEGEENEKEKKRNDWVGLPLAGFVVLIWWFVVLMTSGNCTC